MRPNILRKYNMTGGLLQLIAYGQQDLYLTGNPEMTHFKTVYRRHTNFSMEAVEQVYSGNAMRPSFIISREADLLGPCILEIEVAGLTPGVEYGDRLGFQLIDYVEVEIGGQVIDKHYGDWMDIWTQLTFDTSAYLKVATMVNGNLLANNGNRIVYVPLIFWFCRNPGLYIPIVALQYHDVKINIQFKTSVFLTST
jgi:hypothetical protein